MVHMWHLHEVQQVIMEHFHTNTCTYANKLKFCIMHCARILKLQDAKIGIYSRLKFLYRSLETMKNPPHGWKTDNRTVYKASFDFASVLMLPSLLDYSVGSFCKPHLCLRSCDKWPTWHYQHFFCIKQNKNRCF